MNNEEMDPEAFLKFAASQGIHMITSRSKESVVLEMSDYEEAYVNVFKCCLQYKGIAFSTPTFAVPRINQWKLQDEDEFMEWCNRFSFEIWWLIVNFGCDRVWWLEYHFDFWNSYEARKQKITELLADLDPAFGPNAVGSYIHNYLLY